MYAGRGSSGDDRVVAACIPVDGRPRPHVERAPEPRQHQRLAAEAGEACVRKLEGATGIAKRPRDSAPGNLRTTTPEGRSSMAGAPSAAVSTSTELPAAAIRSAISDTCVSTPPRRGG